MDELNNLLKTDLLTAAGSAAMEIDENINRSGIVASTFLTTTTTAATCYQRFAKSRRNITQDEFPSMLEGSDKSPITCATTLATVYSQSSNASGEFCAKSSSSAGSCCNSCCAARTISNGINSNNPTELACGKQDSSYYKLRQLLGYEDAPKHLQFNPFIRSGYRTILSTKLCLESIFWLTNETVNIWSHVFGCFLFIGLAYSDVVLLQMHASMIDKLIVGGLLVCFQICMILSSIYHTFSCKSEKSYECFLAYDMFGIALSLLAIFISGIYYAFWCNAALRNFYIITIGVIFALAMILQIPRLKVHSNIKMLAFVSWALYGVVPTVHWYIVMGGGESTMVKLFIPRVMMMYLLTGTAFLIYVTKIPERWFVGRVDYIGHSHNWWHVFVLAALYYWHNSGMKYVEFRMTHGCSAGVQYT
ncbi:progestin and adipoQ receptor family member 3 isoform X2 [Toxorhynchites rutilus septentrionalis]|uniref:progestin and adipoQ receptor family member 3 isoform X2 n=1 Tax=Toxorhynchites rutilus septentrionalis TaxID=329112 RepID=UPI002478DE71|nr:progestin and adipoQ receptor family member 3 isoform X2 [Toxorhynchites rutilus septentrionalis]